MAVLVLNKHIALISCHGFCHVANVNPRFLVSYLFLDLLQLLNETLIQIRSDSLINAVISTDYSSLCVDVSR